MALSPEAQLAINDQATRLDWSQEQIDRAMKAHDITPTGEEELAHVETQQTHTAQEIQAGLAITALSPDQQATLDNFASTGVDQDRVDKVKASMLAENQKTSV